MTGVTTANGLVVIFNDRTGLDWRLWPEMADIASAKLRGAAPDAAGEIAIEIECCGGERCRWRGNFEAATVMAADLDDFAARARAA